MKGRSFYPEEDRVFMTLGTVTGEHAHVRYLALDPDTGDIVGVVGEDNGEFYGCTLWGTPWSSTQVAQLSNDSHDILAKLVAIAETFMLEKIGEDRLEHLANEIIRENTN